MNAFICTRIECEIYWSLQVKPQYGKAEIREATLFTTLTANYRRKKAAVSYILLATFFFCLTLFVPRCFTKKHFILVGSWLLTLRVVKKKTGDQEIFLKKDLPKSFKIPRRLKTKLKACNSNGINSFTRIYQRFRYIMNKLAGCFCDF